MKITEDKLQEIAYGLYVIDWERKHISTERELAEYRLYALTELEDAELFDREYDFGNFEDWIIDNGYDGEIHACFDEFREYEYRDYEYMKYLLGNSIFLKAYEEYRLNRVELI